MQMVSNVFRPLLSRVYGMKFPRDLFPLPCLRHFPSAYKSCQFKWRIMEKVSFYVEFRNALPMVSTFKLQVTLENARVQGSHFCSIIFPEILVEVYL